MSYLRQAGYDAMLNHIANTSTAVVALTSEPTNYADTQGAKKVAQATITSADFAVTTGALGYSRRIDFLGKSLGTSAVAGNVTWFALLDVAGTDIVAHYPALLPMTVAVGSPVTAFAKTSLFQIAAVFEELVGA